MRGTWIALVAGAIALAAALSTGGIAGADPRPGEYSMEISIVEDQVAVGATFTAQTRVDMSDQGAYQAAQWQILFPASAVTFVSAEPAAGAPDQCSFADDRDTTILTGCIDVGGANISFSGVTFDVVFTCVAEGEVELVLEEGRTFVAPSIDVPEGPIHVHGDTVTCGAGGTVITPPTSTAIPPQGEATLPPDEQTAIAGTPPAGATEPPSGATDTPATLGPDAATAEAARSATAAAGVTNPEGTETETGDVDGAGQGSSDDDGGNGATPWIIGGIIAAVVAAGAGGVWFYRQRMTSGGGSA